MATYSTELASSGRAKCRGCELPLVKGGLRFGETMMNPRVDRETTFWYHAECAAYKRPAAILEFLGQGSELPEADELRRIALIGEAHPRIARIHTAHISPSSRATCRACREPVEKAAWRVSVVFFEDGYLNPAGYIHARCVNAYAETTESALDRMRRFSPDLSDKDFEDIRVETEGGV
jgi:Poly(ADP-ribose) polymerase and DNA-Ligase Zn-finger region